MTKGRRAADRRRERGGNDLLDDGSGTRPGEIVDPLPSDEDDDDDLPLVSQVREVESSQPVEGTRPAQRSTRDTGPENDPEASFVKAVRRSSRETHPGAGESTAARAAPDRPPRRGARVIVLEGADQGGEADIELTPTLVGRTESAEIGLTDPCVSLRHLEIRWSDDDGFTLEDVGSRSGTLLNGRVVVDEVALRHGDVIALGKTELRFVRGDKIPQPRPAPEPEQPQIEPTERLPTREATRTRRGTVLAPLAPTQRVVEMREKIRRTTVRVIAGSALLLVVAVAAKLVHDRFFTDEAPAQIRAQVAELLADGRNRLRAQDVDGARAAANTVLALDDNNDEAQSLLKMAITETEARDAISLALRLGDEERDVEAEQILKRVPDASVFAPTRDRLRQTLDERGQVRSRRHIETLLDQGRVKEALEAAEKHMATWPEDEEARAIFERVKAAQAAMPKHPGLASARAAFAAGDLARAKQIALDNGLTGYAHDVDDFQASVHNGKAALARFDDAAADTLDRAFRLLHALGGDASSPVFAGVRKPYAKALLVAGTAKLDKNPCAGARQLYRAARVTPDDPAIEAKLRDLDARAVAALDRARAAKQDDAERAAAIAREGVCLARVGSRTYEALRSLSRL